MLGVSIALVADFLAGWWAGTARDVLDAFSRGFWLGLVTGPLLLVAVAYQLDRSILDLMFGTDVSGAVTFAVCAVIGTLGALTHYRLTGPVEPPTS